MMETLLSLTTEAFPICHHKQEHQEEAPEREVTIDPTRQALQRDRQEECLVHLPRKHGREHLHPQLPPPPPELASDPAGRVWS